jgi:hypothetical protein
LFDALYRPVRHRESISRRPAAEATERPALLPALELRLPTRSNILAPIACVHPRSPIWRLYDPSKVAACSRNNGGYRPASDGSGRMTAQMPSLRGQSPVAPNTRYFVVSYRFS